MELIFNKIYAQIKEINIETENCLRVWPDSKGLINNSNTINLQIRVKNPLKGRYGSGKKRNLIATVALSVSELEEILDYAKQI